MRLLALDARAPALPTTLWIYLRRLHTTQTQSKRRTAGGRSGKHQLVFFYGERRKEVNALFLRRAQFFRQIRGWIIHCVLLAG